MIAEPGSTPGGEFPFDRLELLGHGTTGEVWRCRDPRHGLIAVKLVHDGLDAAARERIRREHRVLASVRHPNVVRVFELYESPRLALAMELIDGRPLIEALDDGRELDRDERVDPWRVDHLLGLLRQLLDALGAVHDAGLVHRDVKPDNVLVMSSGTVKLLDLGLATETGRAIIGTPLYMAPEALTMQEVDARTDLYAVGIIAFKALTGSAPFEDCPNFDSFAATRIGSDPPSLRHLIPRIPEDVSAAIAKLIARRPSDRPATARAAARLLLRSTDSTEIHATQEATPVTVVDPSLIGREEPLRDLSRYAATGLGGTHPTAVAVLGEAGIGKTQLVAAWTASLDRDVLILRLQGTPESTPLAAFATPLEELAFSLAGLDPMTALGIVPSSIACLQDLTPRVRELPGFELQPPLLPLTGSDAVRRRADTVQALIVNAARFRPIVFVAEEIDGATETTRQVVARLVADDDARLVTLVTARELDPATLEGLGRDGVVVVTPLQPDEVRALVTSALDATPGSELGRWMWDASAGNPRRAMEALRTAARLNALARHGGIVDLIPGLPEELLDRALAGSALDGMPDDVQAVAAAVAVLGAGCGFDEVVAVARQSSRVTALAVQNLLAARILREVGAGLGFQVERMPHAAIAKLGKDEQRALHRRAAAAAERTAGVDVAVRSVRHWLAAGETGRAMPRLPEAAEALTLRGDPREAHRMLTAGLTHLAARSRRGGARQEALLHILRSSLALTTLEEIEQADADLAAAERLLARDAAGDLALERRLIDAMWARDYRRGLFTRLRPRLEGLLETAREHGDRTSEAFAHERLLQIFTVINDVNRAEAHGRQAIQLALALRDRARLVSALNGMSLVLSNRRDFDGAVRCLRRALRVARFVGLKPIQTILLSNLTAFLSAKGLHFEAMHAAREMAGLARSMADFGRELVATVNLGSARLRVGELAEGLRDLDRAEALLRRTNISRVASVLTLNRAAARLGLGDGAGATTLLDRAIAELPTGGHGAVYMPTALLCRAEAKRLTGDTDGSRRDVERARTDYPSAPTETEARYHEACILFAEGQAERAATVVGPAIDEAAATHELDLLARARTLLALASNDPEPADLALVDAVNSGNPLVELEVRAALVLLLARGDDAERTRVERERALELRDRLAAQCGDDRATFLARTDLRHLIPTDGG